MRLILLVLFIFIGESALASPSFEGLAWMANLGMGAAVLNLVFGIFIMQFIFQTENRSLSKSVIFGVLQLVLTIVSIPFSWIGIAWLVYWIKGLESFVNVLFIVGLFILPVVHGIYKKSKYRKSVG